MPRQPLPYIAFDSHFVPEQDRLDIWRTCIAGALDVSKRPDLPGSAFHASMQAYNLGDILVGTVRDNGTHYESSTAPERTDHILVQTYLQGGHRSLMDGQPVNLSPGQTGVIDLGRHVRSERNGASEIVNVVLPREAMTGLPDLHGLILDPERGRFLADYLTSLLRTLPHLENGDARGIARITRDMVIMCLRPTAENRERVVPQIEAGYLRRAKRLIEARLLDPALSAPLLCAQLGVSRSALYRLFEPLGGVVHYIQSRRLDHLRAQLTRPGEHRRLADLARLYGFSDGAHLSRAFRARFGHSPSESREQQRQAADSGQREDYADEHLTLGRWLQNLAG